MMATLRIEWERLMVRGGKTCPRCRATGRALETAARRLRKVLAKCRIGVKLERKRLSRRIFSKNPLRSNRILINGRPLERLLGGKVSKSSCCGTCGPVQCRTLIVGRRQYAAIPASLVVRAGLSAASKMKGTRCYGASCCGGKATNCC